MALPDLFGRLGPEIEDPEEGMLKEGSWKITPLVASWLNSPDNLLWKTGAFSSASAVLELGCGISGLVGLALSPLVSRYVLTDQTYVARLVEKNLEENVVVQQKSSSQKHWELDEVTASLTGSPDVASFDAVIACDCIYNDTLIEPLVQTCADACNLRRRDQEAGAQGDGSMTPALCIVAQQLRDPEIFEGWIKEFAKHFRVWRVPEEALSKELRANTGFVVHIGVLKNTSAI
ncbi:hypothetical protein ONZ43_g6356 [Nemania bipapillata]|uniref:Uncharacterized protein n=1 Tax=Nemania bipapillata TaxID=110536 RepID=A0ACC2I1M6_9PEZI|nr:hypothetical protein ONZ43_g6356 [Nemania bipapillata]